VDFNLTEEQQAVFDLAGQIFTGHLTPERFKEVDASSDRFDRALWKELAAAGLLGISLPASHGGGGQELLATSMLLEQAGRFAAPIPLLASVVMGGLAVAEWGTAEQQEALLPGVASGDLVLTAALISLDGAVSSTPDGRLDGTVNCVPAGAVADRVLVAATGGVFVVDPASPGVTVTRLITTTHDPDARIELRGAVGERLNGDRDAIVDWITARAISAMCSILAGVCKQAVALTAEYAKTREQFDRPIATFQAVSQRAADAYIDAEAVQLTSRQAAWRLSEGLPASDEVAIAKFFAADAGQRVVHAAQHIHGGTGVDRDYPLHRYFLLAKQLELSLGGATAQLLRLGAAMAASS
jgi:alkylation response protein AidB-like acyl-CoA dehydrogenase